jgi:hypothetical protein
MLMGYQTPSFAIEVNPWAPEEDLREAIFWRGSIVGAWAYSETCLLEIAIRSSHADAYRGLRDHYPQKMHGRLKYLRKILTAPGPLLMYQAKGETLIDDFEAGTEIRNFMAHARMCVSDKRWIRFDCFNGAGPQAASHRHEIYNIEIMEKFAATASGVSRRAQRALTIIDQGKLLPPLSIAEEAKRNAPAKPNKG